MSYSMFWKYFKLSKLGLYDLHILIILSFQYIINQKQQSFFQYFIYHMMRIMFVGFYDTKICVIAAIKIDTQINQWFIQ